MKKKLPWVLGTLGLVLLAIQFIPVDKTNPAPETEVPAPLEVRAVLRRACYDCHSNETAWPWYSGVAPVSWLVARDVGQGRAELNLSTWNRLSTKERSRVRQKTLEEVSEGEMPPWSYVMVHPGARLSEQDKTLLRHWAVAAVSLDAGGQ